MNLPPVFNSIAITPPPPSNFAPVLRDTSATVLCAIEGGITSTIAVGATDTEGNLLTYRAHFLQPWMSWNAGTRTLTCTPSISNIGETNYVKFGVVDTSSGDADSFLGKVHVYPFLGSNAAQLGRDGDLPIKTPNPTSDFFAIRAARIPGVSATLAIVDIAGRTVAVIRGKPGAILAWNGRQSSGALAPPGVYLYRVQVGPLHDTGTIVVVR